MKDYIQPVIAREEAPQKKRPWTPLDKEFWAVMAFALTASLVLLFWLLSAIARQGV